MIRYLRFPVPAEAGQVSSDNRFRCPAGSPQSRHSDPSFSDITITRPDFADGRHTTALAVEGHRHYARSGKETAFLFSETGTTSTKWFREYPWPERISLTQTRFGPRGHGVRAADLGAFSVTASAPEQAILEALHLTRREVDRVEIAEIVEGLRTLRLKLMQKRLEGCTWVKVKRLFLCLAARAGLPVVRHLNRERITPGSGDRISVPSGVYIPEYRLTMPRELAQRG